MGDPGRVDTPTELYGGQDVATAGEPQQPAESGVPATARLSDGHWEAPQPRPPQPSVPQQTPHLSDSPWGGAQPRASQPGPPQPRSPHPSAPQPRSPHPSAPQQTPRLSQDPWASAPQPTPQMPGAGTPAYAHEDEELLGATLNDTYVVLRVLGEGGMGRVYEAQHTRIAGKRYAIKVLHPELARRGVVRARFQREAEAAAAINHPNVVGVYDVNLLPDGRPFLVSELLQGRELGAYLDEHGRLSAQQAAYVVRQVCAALQAAHACGVIHRDVKPENVFLTGPMERPHVKVLDFGISRLEGEGGQTLTRTGVVMGTPSYMAPEQARGERVDFRTDMYATGAILYRSLSGRLPFERNDTMATLAAVLTEAPPRLRTVSPDVPEALELVVQRAMAREAAERYQSMEELGEALAPYDMPPEAPRAPLSSMVAVRQAREAQGARGRLVMLMVVAAAALVLAVISMVAASIQLLSQGGRELGGLEALLVVALVMVALSTPVILLARKLVKGSWDNTPKVLELLEALRGPLLAGLAGSGLLALTLRVVEPVLLRSSAGLGWPLWGLAVPVTGVLAAAAVVVARRSERADPSSPLSRITGPPAIAAAAAGVGLALVAALALRDPLPAAASVASSEPSESAASGRPAGEDKAPNQRANRAETLSAESAEQLVVKLSRQHKGNNLSGSLATLRELAGAPQSVLDRPDVRRLIGDVAASAYSVRGSAAQRISGILLNEMGDVGLEVLFDLMVTRGRTAAARNAERILGGAEVQARASSDLKVAYALRIADGCKAKLALVSRAASEGGSRTLRELKSMRACGGGGCCFSKGDEATVRNAAAAITERIE